MKTADFNYYQVYTINMQILNSWLLIDGGVLCPLQRKSL